MCAEGGGVIRSVGDLQDIRFMGGLSIYTPFTSLLMVSNFALFGVSFLAKFYSKDFSLEMFSLRYVNIFVCCCCLCQAICHSHNIREMNTYWRGDVRENY